MKGQTAGIIIWIIAGAFAHSFIWRGFDSENLPGEALLIDAMVGLGLILALAGIWAVLTAVWKKITKSQ